MAAQRGMVASGSPYTMLCGEGIRCNRREQTMRTHNYVVAILDGGLSSALMMYRSMFFLVLLYFIL